MCDKAVPASGRGKSPVSLEWKVRGRRCQDRQDGGLASRQGASHPLTLRPGLRAGLWGSCPEKPRPAPLPGAALPPTRLCYMCSVTLSCARCPPRGPSTPSLPTRLLAAGSPAQSSHAAINLILPQCVYVFFIYCIFYFVNILLKCSKQTEVCKSSMYSLMNVYRLSVPVQAAAGPTCSAPAPQKALMPPSQGCAPPVPLPTPHVGFAHFKI